MCCERRFSGLALHRQKTFSERFLTWSAGVHAPGSSCTCIVCECAKLAVDVIRLVRSRSCLTLHSTRTKSPKPQQIIQAEAVRIPLALEERDVDSRSKFINSSTKREVTLRHTLHTDEASAPPTNSATNVCIHSAFVGCRPTLVSRCVHKHGLLRALAHSYPDLLDGSKLNPTECRSDRLTTVEEAYPSCSSSVARCGAILHDSRRRFSDTFWCTRILFWCFLCTVNQFEDSFGDAPHRNKKSRSLHCRYATRLRCVLAATIF